MILPDLKIENSIWRQGNRHVVGIDEVGRGSWAGPLVVAGVIFPQNVILPDGLADSKLLKHRQRVRLTKIINKIAIDYAIVEISVKCINRINIGKATHQAFRKVITSLSIKPDYYLIDAFYINHISKKYQKAVKNGDKICASIAAASIIAKVYRDKIMRKLHYKYPNYGFGKHKGYGTKIHQSAIKTHGLTAVHRLSFNLNCSVS